MRRRVAKKIEKRINAGAQCPRLNGRGYREDTRAKAAARLYPRLGRRLESFGPSPLTECYAIWDRWRRMEQQIARALGIPRSYLS